MIVSGRFSLTTFLPLLLLLVLAGSPLYAETDLLDIPSENDDPVIALVLAGGGALGFAHIGVIRAVEEAGIEPDLVVGTSMGSLVGALYSAGYSADEMERTVVDTDWKETLFDTVPRGSLSYRNRTFFSSYYLNVPLRQSPRTTDIGGSHAQHVVEFLDRLLEKYPVELDFDTLPRRFRAVATDLMSGERIVYDYGDLKTVLRASMSVPGIFTPVYYNERYLVDGGVVDNTPVLAAAELGADIIIAVSLGGLKSEPAELTSMSSMLLQIIEIKDRRGYEENIAAADLVIRPDLTGFTPFNYEQGEGLIKAGYLAAEARISELRRITSVQAVRGGSQPAAVPPATIEVSSISVVPGEPRGQYRQLEEYLREKIPRRTSVDTIRQVIYGLYDSSAYTHAWYRLRPQSDGTCHLEVDAEQRLNPDSVLGVGLVFEGSATDNTASTQRVSLAYTRFFTEEQRYGFILQAWLSELSSLKASLLFNAHPRLSLLNSAYLHQSPQYIYDDEAVSALYALQRIGWDLSVIYAVWNSTAVGVRPYLEHREIYRRYGERIFEGDSWNSYGVKAFFSLDTLDRVVTPTRGVSVSLVNDLRLDEWKARNATIRFESKLFAPLSRGLILDLWVMNQLLFDTSAGIYEYPTLGGIETLKGYYAQEIRSPNILAAGAGIRLQIATLPLGAGNEVYLQFSGNSGMAWDEEPVGLPYTPSYYGGGAVGVVANTLLGEASISVALNDEGRLISFIGLRNSISNIFE